MAVFGSEFQMLMSMNLLSVHQMALCPLIVGWIYAVYSPVESVSFSGIFLHSFAISDQLSVYKLEQRLKVRSPFWWSFAYFLTKNNNCWALPYI